MLPDIVSDLAEREIALERSAEAILASPQAYRDGEHVPEHAHGRSQLLHALTGVATVTTALGRWLVPPEHALWIPARTVHAVDIIGDVLMYSVYVRPDALPGLPAHLHVAALTPLMRSLIHAAREIGIEAPRDERSRFIMGCLLHEIPHLEERPLNVPFPAHPRLAALCRRYLSAPTAHTDIDLWAASAGMSRRTFTRIFRKETGLSLSAWRQQACLVSALPRLSAGEPVTSVALDLGYDSVPAFTTMFKRVLGAAPKAYLRSAA
ncbi:MAG: AraC family transcriptional regulator [Pararhizobium sp.]